MLQVLASRVRVQTLPVHPAVWHACVGQTWQLPPLQPQLLTLLPHGLPAEQLKAAWTLQLLLPAAQPSGNCPGWPRPKQVLMAPRPQ